jgi:hypothetical protein
LYVALCVLHIDPVVQKCGGNQGYRNDNSALDRGSVDDDTDVPVWKNFRRILHGGIQSFVQASSTSPAFHDFANITGLGVVLSPDVAQSWLVNAYVCALLDDFLRFLSFLSLSAVLLIGVPLESWYTPFTANVEAISWFWEDLTLSAKIRCRIFRAGRTMRMKLSLSSAQPLQLLANEMSPLTS